MSATFSQATRWFAVRDPNLHMKVFLGHVILMFIKQFDRVVNMVRMRANVSFYIVV